MAAIIMLRRARLDCLCLMPQLVKSFFLFGLFLFMAASLTASPTDIEIISSSANELHFKVVNCSGPGKLQNEIDLDSNQVFFRSFQIALPPKATARIVSAVGHGPKSSSRSLTSSLSRRIVSLAKLSEPLSVRGRELVSLMVFPLSSTELYDEIEIQINFVGGLSTDYLPGSPDPHFDRILGSKVINLDQMKSWPRESQRASKLALSAEDISLAGNWLKIYVDRTGLHTITGAQLEEAGLSLSSLVSDSIRLYYSDGLPLEIPNENPRPLFSEIAIMVEDGSDSFFGANDRLYFYGEAVDRWVYPEGEPARFINNVYTRENVYWLATAGSFASPSSRMNSVNLAPTGSADTTLTSVWHSVHAEEDNLLLSDAIGHIDSYHRWFWSNETSFSLFVPTPGAIASEAAIIDLSGRSGGSVQARFNGTAGTVTSCGRYGCSWTSTALVDGLNQVDLVLQPDGASPPGVDYLNIKYRRRLNPESDRLSFVLENMSGTAEVVISNNFSSTPYLLDITDQKQVTLISGYDNTGGEIRFEADLSISPRRRFALMTKSAAFAPKRIEAAQPLNLRNVSTQIDLLIVTARQFIDDLAEYADYRRAGGLTIQLVAVEDIMDNFGFGLYDPTAIRDFLKFTYENYPAPSPYAVLFVGDANYDFCDVLNTGQPNLVPAYTHSLPSSWDNTYSDDNYLYFDKYGLLDSDTSRTRSSDFGVDMIAARWPVSSSSEIDLIVSKIKQYDDPSNFGVWRSRITLVADDEFGGTYNNETIHTSDSEKLDTLIIPIGYASEKIYMVDYPRINNQKPAVNEAIVKAFNDGALIVNYVGHGNPDIWAHEHVFSRSSDLPRLTNTDQLPLVFAASCAIGFFDDPKREGMAEDLLAMANGGAMAIISATRLVYAGDNALFNRAAFGIFFDQPELSICEAMYAAKLDRQYRNDSTMFPVTNDRAYAFFGDPCQRLGVPRLGVVFDERPDSLTALARHHVAGHLVDSSGLPVAASGFLNISLYDSDRNMTYWLAGGSQKVDYTLAGPALFRGRAEVNSSGEFSFDFVAPLDIGFGGQSAKLVVYATVGSFDALGAVDSIKVSDQVTVSTDSIGPEIFYTFSGRDNFISGDMISVGDILEIRLSDSSGINLSGGLGHGIVLEIDSDPSATVVLNDAFEFDQDDYTTGWLRQALTDLEPGEHSFKIRAWDNANNSSSVEFSVNLAPSGTIAINNLLNYPNPMQLTTTFYFELTQAVERFGLDIFTLSGKKIKSFNRTALLADNYPNSSWTLTWDGQDADGDRVATGVYLYKATAASESGAVAESFGKIVVIN